MCSSTGKALTSLLWFYSLQSSPPHNSPSWHQWRWQVSVVQAQLQSYFASGVKPINEVGEENPTLSRSCLPELRVGGIFPLRLLWCWVAFPGDATEWLPSQMAMNWQLKRALCRKKSDMWKCSLTNGDGIGVTEVGSGFSRQICYFQFV